MLDCGVRMRYLLGKGRRIQNCVLLLIQVGAIHEEALNRRQGCATRHLLQQPYPSFGCSATQTWKFEKRGIDCGPQPGGNSSIGLCPIVGVVLAVPRKQFVATYSRQQYGRVLAGLSDRKSTRLNSSH